MALKISELSDAFPQALRGSAALLNQILASAARQHIPPGRQIYSSGDQCTAIAFVNSGLIRVYSVGETGREITLYEIGPGETCILNASCILSGGSYPANAATLTDVDLLLIPSPSFKKMIEDHREMRDFVFTIISRRLANVMELVEEVAFGRMDERLMEYLGQKSKNGALQTTHQKIAADLGTSREVVSRLLKDFERKKRLVLSRNSITLLQ